MNNNKEHAPSNVIDFSKALIERKFDMLSKQTDELRTEIKSIEERVKNLKPKSFTREEWFRFQEMEGMQPKLDATREERTKLQEDKD